MTAYERKCITRINGIFKSSLCEVASLTTGVLKTNNHSCARFALAANVSADLAKKVCDQAQKAFRKAKVYVGNPATNRSTGLQHQVIYLEFERVGKPMKEA